MTLMAGKGALLLISLAVGYYVLLAAGKEKKQEKLLGQIIGWLIVVLSALGIWCYAQQCITTIQSGGDCPFTGKMMSTPGGQNK